MMQLSKEEIGRRAEEMAERAASPKLKIEIVEGESLLGGGAAPSSMLPTRLLAVSCAGLSADELAARLRGSEPAIVARVEDGRVLLDLRTVFPEQDAAVAEALGRISA
jgi:L-seryl-tRNA(Ser) seleniumtransferase